MFSNQRLHLLSMSPPQPYLSTGATTPALQIMALPRHMLVATVNSFGELGETLTYSLSPDEYLVTGPLVEHK